MHPNTECFPTDAQVAVWPLRGGSSHHTVHLPSAYSRAGLLLGTIPLLASHQSPRHAAMMSDSNRQLNYKEIVLQW
jgi:hypothetical protein